MDEHVLKTYKRADEVFVTGHGAILRDQAGREYLDFLAGIAVSALGHAHPELVAALRDQMGKVLHLSNLYRHAYTEPVASLIAELTGLEACFFTNSGTEAIEAALKIARAWQRKQGAPERTSFVACEGAFHGRTLGALSLTHAEKYRAPFGPLLPVRFVPPDDVAALQAALRERPAAFVVEPVQGEGGIRELSAAYLRAARALCTETGTVLVHDEIQCGCGRTGRFLAADWADVKPDLLALAKPIAAGLPMGLCVAAKALEGTLQPGEHGSTFAGGPLVCRAALVFLRLVREGLLEQVQARGDQLRQGLERLARQHPIVKEVRGRGLMLGLRLHREANALQQALYRRAVITNCTAGDVIRIVPPFVITEEQVDEGLRRFHGALQEIEALPP